MNKAHYVLWPQMHNNFSMKYANITTFVWISKMVQLQKVLKHIRFPQKVFYLYIIGLNLTFG